jgi:hypothetical protein
MNPPEDHESNKASSLIFSSFDTKLENILFSTEISVINEKKIEKILFRALEKSSISKVIYTNCFNFEELLKKSKVFKMCENVKEAYEVIQQKFKDNEIAVCFDNDDFKIIIEFILPNKKVDKVIFTLLKEKLGDSELIEQLFANVAYLQKKNELLENELNKVKSIIIKKKSKSLIDIIVNKFKESKFSLLTDLYRELDRFDLEKDYLEEIGNKFQAKVTTIFNAKKDGDTLSGIISKVFGKKNLAGFISVQFKEFEVNDKEKKNEKEKFDTSFDAQLVYLDGKLEFENGFLPFLQNSVFSYGTYGSGREDGRFTFFRNQNDKLYIKIDKNSIYFIALKNGNQDKFIFKVNDHFLKNPIYVASKSLEKFDSDEWDKLDKNEASKNQTENLGKAIENLFNEKEGKFAELHVKELKIYQIDN